MLHRTDLLTCPSTRRSYFKGKAAYIHDVPRSEAPCEFQAFWLAGWDDMQDEWLRAFPEQRHDDRPRTS